MEVAVVEENDGGGGTGDPLGGTCAAPAELPKSQGAVVAETDDTSAEQPCKHFSMSGYVSQKMDAKFCSLSQIFHGQQQLDENHNSLYPFSVAKFRRWDCSVCLDEAKILDDRTTSRAVFTAKNVSRDGCSIRFVRSTLVPTSLDFRSLFPCTQQLAQAKNPDRSALLKSNLENNCKCNSPYEANTDPPMKDLQGPSTNQVIIANILDNASVDIMALPEDSKIRANREGNAIAIPSSSKLHEATVMLNAAENGKNKEVLSVDHTIPNFAKPISGQKGDQVCNSGPCEEVAPKRSIGSTCKKKKGKPNVQVGSSDVKIVRRKQIKLRLLSEIINTDPAGGSRSDIEVNGEKVADICDDDRSTDNVLSVDHQAVGEILSKTMKNKANDKGVDVVDDESSLMNWMKKIPKRLRTEKKDSEHKDCDSSASKPTADVFASKDTHQDFLSSGWKLSKKNTLPTTSMQQGDENIPNDNLERNKQTTDDMRQMEAENSTERSLSNIKNISLSKRKMPPTASVQHDGGVPVSRQMVGEISSKTGMKKTKYKGGDAVDDEGSLLMEWMKRIPKKLRTEKKDTEYKDNDSSAANSKYTTVDKVALKDVQDDFISSAQELSKRKILPTSTREGAENIQNNNLAREVQNTNDICETESENCRQRSLSKVKKTSLRKRKIPSTANAQHNDVNTEETAVLRTDDQCQMVPRSSVQRRLAKVSPGKRVIRNVTAVGKKLPKKRNKQTQEVMHEKHAMIDDIPMDIVELLVRTKDMRPLITETDSADISHTQSKIMEDEDCTVIAAEDGPNYASSVIDTSQQKGLLEPDSYQNALQNRVAATTQATHTHALKLQNPGHVNSIQEPQTHLGMRALVTIAATSPLLSQDEDQTLTEATPECWSHKGAKKSMWESFKAVPRDLSTSKGCAQFRSVIDTVDLTYTHVAGASNDYYPTRQPLIPALDHYTNRAVNPVQARSFPSSMSTMEAGNLCDRRNVGHSGFYPRETMPATHPLRLTESPMLASFNYEGSSRNQMEFQLRNSHYAQDQCIGSASTPYGAHNQYKGSASTLCGSHNQYIGSASSLGGAHNQYIGSASTPYGSNLNAMGSASMPYGSNLNAMGSASTPYGSNLNGMGSASTSYGSNLNGKIPLTLDDLSRHPLQPNLHKPLRPNPRVGVLSSLLQKEIADWSESCGTQSGYKIGLSKGITSFDMNRRGNVEALNSGMYSAAWNARQLSSVSYSPGFSSVRSGAAQSWTRDQGRMTNPLDKLVRQDICVTNRNPCDFTIISDDNEYMREDI